MCGALKGDARQALIARIGHGFTVWLCHDCADRPERVCQFIAAYRAARSSTPGDGTGEGMAAG